MTIGPFNHGHSVPQPSGDDVDGLAGADEITGKASAHVVDGALDSAPPHVAGEEGIEVIPVSPEALRLLWLNGELILVPPGKEVIEKFLEASAQLDGPILPVL